MTMVMRAAIGYHRRLLCAPLQPMTKLLDAT